MIRVEASVLTEAKEKRKKEGKGKKKHLRGNFGPKPLLPTPPWCSAAFNLLYEYDNLQ